MLWLIVLKAFVQMWPLQFKLFDHTWYGATLVKGMSGTRLVEILYHVHVSYSYVKLFYNRNPVPNQRIDPREVSRTLQKSDRMLLFSSTAANNDEETSTQLGAPLDTSIHIFSDLQNVYLS